MRFKIDAFESQDVRRVEIRIERKVDEVSGGQTAMIGQGKDARGIRYDRRDKTVAEFAKIFRKNAQTRG